MFDDNRAATTVPPDPNAGEASEVFGRLLALEAALSERRSASATRGMIVIALIASALVAVTAAVTSLVDPSITRGEPISAGGVLVLIFTVTFFAVGYWRVRHSLGENMTARLGTDTGAAPENAALNLVRTQKLRMLAAFPWLNEGR